MFKSLSDVTLKGGDSGEVEAVFSRFDVIDKDNDVTLRGAFTEGAPVVISSYGHKSWEGQLPVGTGTIHEDGDKAILKGRFFLNTTHGRDTWETVKELSAAKLQEWSYSLDQVQAKAGEFDGRKVRIIERVGLVKEVSPVLLGAGVDTMTMSTKSLKFSDHLDTVVADVDELIERATEVMALRASKGKSISADSSATLTVLDETIARLKELLGADGATPPQEETPPNLDELAAQYARFIALTTGA